MRVKLQTKDTEALKELQTHLENNGYNSKEDWDTDFSFNFDIENISEIKTILSDRKMQFEIEEIKNFQKNLRKNFEKFREETLLKSKEDIFDDWYKINFYQSFFELLNSDFIEPYVNRFPNLLKKSSPLNRLYKIWLDCDDAPSGDWDIMLDFISVNDEEEAYE